MKREHRIIIYGIAFVLLFWVMDVTLGNSSSHGKSLWELLVADVPEHDLYMRVILLVSVIVFVIVLSRVLAQRRRTEESLRESEERYRTIMDDIEEAYYEADLAGNLTFVNDAACRILGYSREELIGMDNRAYMDQENAKLAYETYSEVHRTGKPDEWFTWEVLRKDGDRRSIEGGIYPLRGPKGDILGFRGVARDATERKQAEKALQQSDERWHLLFDNATQGVMYLDSQGTINAANPAALEIVALPPEELVGKDFRQLLPVLNLTDADVLPVFRRITSGEPGPERLEWKIMNGQGKPAILDVASSTVEKDGRAIGFAIFVHDITERKQIQQALQEGEERYRLITDNMEDTVWLMDMNLRTTFVSPSVVRTRGFTLEELREMPLEKHLTPTSLEVALKEIAERMSPKKLEQKDYTFTHTFDLEFYRKDGSTFWHEVKATLLRDDEGCPAGLLCVSRDITERKHAEEALRESEEKYRILAEQSMDGICLASGFKPVYANSALLNILGAKSIDDLRDRTFLDFLDKQDVDTIVNDVAKGLAGEITKKRYELRAKKLNGEEFFLDLSMTRVMYEGKPHALAIARDITDKKGLEEALRDSEKRYRLLAENVTDIIWTMDMDLRFTYVSPSVTRLSGFSTEEATTHTVQDVFTPSSLEVAMKALEEEIALEKREEKDLTRSRMLELELRCKDGSTVWTEMTITALRDQNGRPVEFTGIARDITKRKQAHEKLRESEERYRNLISNLSNTVIMELNSEGKFTYVSPQIFDIFGHTPEESIGLAAFDFVHPDDIEKCFEAMTTKDEVVQIEYRSRHKDGHYIYVSTTGKKVPDGRGGENLISVASDITERKQAEEALRQSEERYRTILETVEEVYFEVDLAGNFTFVGDAVCRISGYSKEEMIGTSYRTYAPEKDVKAVYEAFNRVYRTGKPIEGFYGEIFRKDGTKRFLETSALPARNQGGEIIGFRGVMRDVTKRKETERQLLAAETAVKTCNSAIVTADFDGRLTYANPAVLRVWGYDNLEEVVGKSFTSLFKEEEEARKLVEMLFTREYDERLDFVGKRKDGTEFIAGLSAAAIVDAERQHAGFTASVTDITDRMQAVEALQKSELQFRGVINKNADGIAILDKHGVARLVNPAAQAMFNRSAEELVGQMLGLPTAAGTTTEVDIVNIEGQTRVAEMQVVEIDWEGAPAYLTSLHDITERKRAEEDGRELDRMKSEFISNISHELRTPLHSIQGFTELMLEGEVPDPGTQKRFLTIIDKQSQRLGRLIANLLDISRLESGRFSIQKQRSSMANIIRDACQSSFVLASAKGISINEDIPQTLPEIEVDGERLTQVMVNLLGNAIKFSNDGSVTVKAELKNGDLLVQVVDQGIGIPKEAMSHLFDRFYRVEDPAEVGGAGLGLYISKQIIEAHGGDLWAESEHREGSTFSFTIPVVSRKRRPKKKIGEILVEDGHITKKDLHSALKKQQTQETTATQVRR